MLDSRDEDKDKKNDLSSPTLHISTEQLVLKFQVPRIGMPIISPENNEVSVSISHLFSTIAPRKIFSNLFEKQNRGEVFKQIQRKRNSEILVKKAFQKGFNKKRNWHYINRQMNRARRSAEGWDFIPSRWGKNVVMVQMIITAIKEAASLRCGITISFNVSEATHLCAKKSRQIVTNHGEFIEYIAQKPVEAFYKVFFPPIRLRGWEDSLQLLLWVFVNPVTVSLELLLKMLGASLTQPSRRIWLGIFNKENNVMQCARYSFFGIFVLPIWGLGQICFILGNTLGYGRRSIDAFFNMISIIMAFFSGNLEKYPLFSHCLGLFSINMLQLFVAYVGLTSLLLIPDKIPYSLAIFSLPITKTALDAIPKAVTSLYSAISVPLKAAISSEGGTRFISGLTTLTTVSTFLQITEGLIETFLIKFRNNTIKNTLVNCVYWFADKVYKGPPNSIPNLELAMDEVELTHSSPPTENASDPPFNVNTAGATTSSLIQTLLTTSNSSTSSTSSSSSSSTIISSESSTSSGTLSSISTNSEASSNSSHPFFDHQSSNYGSNATILSNIFSNETELRTREYK